MKFKYFFALILILTIIFSFGTVVASENVNASSTQDAYLSIDDSSSGGDVQLSSVDSDDGAENQNADLINQGPSDSSSDDNVDLSVYMDLGDIDKQTFGIGEVTFQVPLIITAKVSDGVAKNAKVNITIPKYFNYVSSTKNIGEYDSSTGIWDIGDLNSGFDAKLTILTKINTKGTFIIYVNATSDSLDSDLSNNYLECRIQVSSKITSNTTRTSADQGIQHNPHQGSVPDNGGRVNVDDNPKGNDDVPPNNGGGPGTGGGPSQNGGGPSTPGGKSPSNGGSSSSGSDSGSGSQSGGQGSSSDSNNNAVKEIDPNRSSNAVKSIVDTINDILNPDSADDVESNGSKSVVKAIDDYDYTQIPIMIFALFLVALIGIFAYDKIKS